MSWKDWPYWLKGGIIFGSILTILYLVNLLLDPPGVNIFGNYIIGIPQTFLHGFIIGIILVFISKLISKIGKSQTTKGGIIGITLSILIIPISFLLPNRVYSKYLTGFITNYLFEMGSYSFISLVVWLLLGLIIGLLIGKNYENKS